MYDSMSRISGLWVTFFAKLVHDKYLLNVLCIFLFMPKSSVKSLKTVPNAEGRDLSNCKWSWRNQCPAADTFLEMWSCGNSRPLWNNSFFINNCSLFCLVIHSIDVNWCPFNICFDFLEVELVWSLLQKHKILCLPTLIFIHFGNINKKKRNIYYIQKPFDKIGVLKRNTTNISVIEMKTWVMTYLIHFSKAFKRSYFNVLNDYYPPSFFCSNWEHNFSCRTLWIIDFSILLANEN